MARRADGRVLAVWDLPAADMTLHTPARVAAYGDRIVVLDLPGR